MPADKRCACRADPRASVGLQQAPLWRESGSSATAVASLTVSADQSDALQTLRDFRRVDPRASVGLRAIERRFSAGNHFTA